MSKELESPYDLSHSDPKLKELLEKRDKLVSRIAVPLKQGQQSLARLPQEPGSVSVLKIDPNDFPSLLVDFDNRWAKLESHDQVIARIQLEKKDTSLHLKLQDLEAQEASLIRIQKGEFTHDVLAKYAPKVYSLLENGINEKHDLKKQIAKLESLYSGWWQRVIVDFFRNIYNITPKQNELYELSIELEELDLKNEKLEAKALQVAMAQIGSTIKATNASIQQMRSSLAKNKSIFDVNESNAQQFRVGLLAKVHKSREKLQAGLDSFRVAAIQMVVDATDAISNYLYSLPMAAVLPWDAPEWDSWPPKDDKGKAILQPFISGYLRIGEIREKLKPRLARLFAGESLRRLEMAIRPVTLPVVIPFIGMGRTLVVSCNESSRDDALKIVQSLILRSAAMLGRQVKFTLLDPVGHGQAFPIQRFLDSRPTDDVNKDLKDVQQNIRRINQNVLTGEAGLHELDKRRLASEQFEMVVAAGFPDVSGFDRRSVETLFNLGSVGPRAGCYVVLHYDRSKPLPREYPIDSLSNAFILDPQLAYTAPADFHFYFDMPPSIVDQQSMLERIKDAGKVDHALSWDDVIKPERDSEWWTGSSETEISTPIGLRGGADKAIFWLGQKSGGEVCSHGLLAGMTGSGKSTLYHDLILGLAARYSPEELKLYLIDLKQGVEFQPYKDLPHAVVLSLNSPAELTLSILVEMEREMEARNQIFKSAGVGSYTEYRRLGHSMPRVLMLIDEYQRLFTDDLADAASSVLLRLSQQGRSAGLHMFLGSQGFGAPGMLNQTAIFANFHLRVAMKLQPTTIDGLSEFGPTGKRLIRGITMAGKFVLNDSGQDEKTIDGQAALLKSDRRNQLILNLRDRAKVVCYPEVFDGDAPTDVFGNKAIQEVLAQRGTMNGKSLEALARKEEGTARGFGQQRWVAGDRPLGMWLGRRFNVHGHTMAVMPRNVQQNLIIVGSPAEARAGILAGLLTSVAFLYTPSEIRIDVLFAGGDDDDPSLHTCDRLTHHLLKKAGHTVSFSREVMQIESLLSDFGSDLALRKEKGARDAPSRLLVLIEPDRVPMLRRTGDIRLKLSPQQEHFRRLLAEGSQYGLHVVMAFSVFSLVALVIDKRNELTYFAHRVGFQMSNNDSYDFFGNREATNLQSENNKVPVALYQNTEMNDAIRFKPYAVPELGVINKHAQTLAKIYAGQQIKG